MRILHVITGLDVGGAEMMLAKLLRQTAKEHESRVVSLTGDGPIGERIRALGVETAFLGMRRGVPDPRGIIALAREIRAFRPTVVQTWLYHADLVGGVAALLSGRPPVVWGLRNADLDSTDSKWTTRLTLRLCARLSEYLPARIVSCSERARDFHVARGYDAGRVVIIPNGFDVSAFTQAGGERDDVRRELGIPAQAGVVGMVARYHPTKDFRNFARAAGEVARNVPGVWFALCGAGVTEDNAELRGWLAEAGVLDRSRLLGQRRDVGRLLSALDVFTLSSRTEGFPNALGEAMACGIPSVATDVGDCAAVLGDTGRVVPPNDSVALSAAWRDLLRLPEDERSRIGAAGRRRIVELFSIQSVAARYVELYESTRRPAGQSTAPTGAPSP